MVGEIESAKDSAKMLKAIRTLRRFKQTKNITVKVNEKVISQPEEAVKLIAQHFRRKLTDETIDTIITPEFQGPLETPITKEEIICATKTLKNGRAAGPDQIPGEFLKYGPAELLEQIANI